MVSVVIPNYNSNRMLANCVKSVFEQGVKVEIIVVDDCSKDDSVIFLKKWIEKSENTICKTFISNPKENDREIQYEIRQRFHDETSGISILRIVRNSENKGVAYSRNRAVKMSNGEFVAFLDADDYWDKDKLIKQIALLENSKAAFCNTARELIEANGISTGRVIATPEKITLAKLKTTNYVNCSSVLIWTDIVRKYPMEHSDAQEDYLTWIRILQDYEYAIGINEPLLKYRLTPGSKSRNKLKSAVMTYRTYRYAKFGVLQSVLMMISYTWNGVKKYTKKQKNR